MLKKLTKVLTFFKSEYIMSLLKKLTKRKEENKSESKCNSSTGTN
nr:MAG TPA: hypothetical protein [Caudoviricetes sp.]